MEKSERSKLGKKTRAAGKRFELKVRADLESKGWIVCRWSNQVEFSNCDIGHDPAECPNNHGKIVPAKSKYNFFRKCMSQQAGFPDFIAHKRIMMTKENGKFPDDVYCEVIGVECKSGELPRKEERNKLQWLLSNNVFSKIYIAVPGEKRGSVEYKEFQLKQMEVKDGNAKTSDHSI